MRIEKELREAFAGIQAGEELKARTQAYLVRRTRESAQKHRVRHPARWILAACVLALTVGLAAGRWLYFTPVSSIHIEINPAIALSVNRFGRVIGQEGENPDGKALTETLDLRFLDYQGAVERLLEDEGIAALLDSGQAMSIYVACQDESQWKRMVADLEKCTQGRHNVRCHGGSEAAGKQAHKRHRHRGGQCSPKDGEQPCGS